jgi:hypothetical protein
VEATAVLVDAHCNVCRHYGAKPAFLNSMQQKMPQRWRLDSLAESCEKLFVSCVCGTPTSRDYAKEVAEYGSNNQKSWNWCQNFEIDVLVRKGTPRPSKGANCAPGLERLHRLNRLGGQRCAQVLRRSPHVFLLSSCFDWFFGMPSVSQSTTARVRRIPRPCWCSEFPIGTSYPRQNIVSDRGFRKVSDA